MQVLQPNIWYPQSVHVLLDIVPGSVIAIFAVKYTIVIMLKTREVTAGILHLAY